MMTEKDLLMSSDMSMYGLLHDRTIDMGKNFAIEYMGEKITYSQFLDRIDGCAKALEGYGIIKGDRVVVCLPNMPEALVTIYAANKIGAVCWMMHPLSSKSEAEAAVEKSKSRLAVCLDRFCDKFASAKLDILVMVSPADSLGRIKRAIYSSVNRAANKIERPGLVIPWQKFLKINVNSNHKITNTGSDPALILSSSGTGSYPKAVVLSSMNINAFTLQVQKFDESREINGAVLCVLPVFHGFGLCLNIMAALISGKKCILVPRYSSRAIGRIILRKRIRYLIGVPLLFEKIITNPLLRKANFYPLDFIACGGDTLSDELYNRINGFLLDHGSIVNMKIGYGLTECVSACSFMSEGAYHRNCIGRPLPGMRMKIASGPDDELPANTLGEIWVTGPSVMIGYLEDPEATAETLLKATSGTVWLKTGDMGSMDTEGNFYFAQRIKRIIKKSGFNVFPYEAEEALLAHPNIEQACVVGSPSMDAKTRVVAFVITKTASVETTEAELKEYCRKKLNRWSLPERIFFVGEMPVTMMKKIDTAKLEEIALGRLDD